MLLELPRKLSVDCGKFQKHRCILSQHVFWIKQRNRWFRPSEMHWILETGSQKGQNRGRGMAGSSTLGKQQPWSWMTFLWTQAFPSHFPMRFLNTGFSSLDLMKGLGLGSITTQLTGVLIQAGLGGRAGDAAFTVKYCVSVSEHACVCVCVWDCVCVHMCVCFLIRSSDISPLPPLPMGDLAFSKSPQLNIHFK